MRDVACLFTFNSAMVKNMLTIDINSRWIENKFCIMSFFAILNRVKGSKKYMYHTYCARSLHPGLKIIFAFG